MYRKNINGDVLKNTIMLFLKRGGNYATNAKFFRILFKRVKAAVGGVETNQRSIKNPEGTTRRR